MTAMTIRPRGPLPTLAPDVAFRLGDAAQRQARHLAAEGRSWSVRDWERWQRRALRHPWVKHADRRYGMVPLIGRDHTWRLLSLRAAPMRARDWVLTLAGASVMGAAALALGALVVAVLGVVIGAWLLFVIVD